MEQNVSISQTARSLKHSLREVQQREMRARSLLFALGGPMGQWAYFCDDADDSGTQVRVSQGEAQVEGVLYDVGTSLVKGTVVHMASDPDYGGIARVRANVHFLRIQFEEDGPFELARITHAENRTGLLWSMEVDR